MASKNKWNKAKNSYVERFKSLTEKKIKLKRIEFYNSCNRRVLKEETKKMLENEKLFG